MLLLAEEESEKELAQEAIDTLGELSQEIDDLAIETLMREVMITAMQCSAFMQEPAVQRRRIGHRCSTACIQGTARKRA